VGGSTIEALALDCHEGAAAASGEGDPATSPERYADTFRLAGA